MVLRATRYRTGAMLAALLVCCAAMPAMAADATIKQVYDTAKSGDIDGALTMMAPVLKDHPDSAKAHYIEAELLAKAGRLGEARPELAKAKSLDPGLAGISSHSVRELEAKLNSATGLVPASRIPGTVAPGTIAPGMVPAPQHSSVPWGLIIIAGLVIFGIVALLARRSSSTYVQSYGGPTPVQPGYGAPMPGPGYGPGYGAPGYGGGMMGGGGGGGLMGSLASGAAMGAGFAVGEEVVDHLMGGGERRNEGFGGGGYAPTQPQVDPDADMGGNDFGIADGGSWDDNSSGGGGGGDDGGW
jgi:hypothetical protein